MTRRKFVPHSWIWLFLFLLTLCNGLFHKISIPHSPPPPPPFVWTTLNWVPKDFKISKKDNSSFRRTTKPADSKSWGIPEILEKFMDFQSGSLSIYYRISSVVHWGGGGGGVIFWNSSIWINLVVWKVKFPFYFLSWQSLRKCIHTLIEINHYNTVQ